MKIAVIDDGIHLAASGYIKHLLFDMEYVDGKIQKRISPVSPDSHGTVVGNIIQSYEKTAGIGSVKSVWHETGGLPQALAAAIRWCADAGVDVIHMSLGTVEWQDFIVIDQAVRSVPCQIQIIAARENAGRHSVPASLPSVWSAASYRLGGQCRVIKKENGAYDICADLLIPMKLKMKYGMHIGWSNSYQAAAVTGCLVKEHFFSYASKNADLLKSTLEKYAEARDADDVLPRLQVSWKEKEATEIPVVWIKFENEKRFLYEEMVSFVESFHKGGYYAVSLRDMQPDNGGRRSFFENYRRKITQADIEKLLNGYRCDLMFIFSDKQPLDAADSLLSVTEQELIFYDLQEMKCISMQKMDDAGSWTVLAEKMILAGYAG